MASLPRNNIGIATKHIESLWDRWAREVLAADKAAIVGATDKCVAFLVLRKDDNKGRGKRNNFEEDDLEDENDQNNTTRRAYQKVAFQCLQVLSKENYVGSKEEVVEAAAKDWQMMVEKANILLWGELELEGKDADGDASNNRNKSFIVIVSTTAANKKVIFAGLAPFSGVGGKLTKREAAMGSLAALEDPVPEAGCWG